MVPGSFNIYFFFLDALKIVVCFSFMIATMYLPIAEKEIAENWQNPSIRNKDIFGKLLLSLFQGIIFLLLSTVFLGVFYLTGYPKIYEQQYLDEFNGLCPLGYVPTTSEAIIYACIIFLILISLFTSIFWYYSRIVKVTGYKEDKKTIKLDIIRLLLGLIINLLIWGVLLPVFFDQAFIDILYPEQSTRYELLGAIFSSKPHLFLLIQLGVIILLNIFYIIDGLLANKKRKNFVEIDLIETAIES